MVAAWPGGFPRRARATADRAHDAHGGDSANSVSHAAHSMRNRRLAAACAASSRPRSSKVPVTESRRRGAGRSLPPATRATRGEATGRGGATVARGCIPTTASAAASISRRCVRRVLRFGFPVVHAPAFRHREADHHPVRRAPVRPVPAVPHELEVAAPVRPCEIHVCSTHFRCLDVSELRAPAMKKPGAAGFRRPGFRSGMGRSG